MNVADFGKLLQAVFQQNKKISVLIAKEILKPSLLLRMQARRFLHIDKYMEIVLLLNSNIQTFYYFLLLLSKSSLTSASKNWASHLKD